MVITADFYRIIMVKKFSFVKLLQLHMIHYFFYNSLVFFLIFNTNFSNILRQQSFCANYCFSGVSFAPNFVFQMYQLRQYLELICANLHVHISIIHILMINIYSYFWLKKYHMFRRQFTMKMSIWREMT